MRSTGSQGQRHTTQDEGEIIRNVHRGDAWGSARSVMVGDDHVVIFLKDMSLGSCHKVNYSLNCFCNKAWQTWVVYNEVVCVFQSVRMRIQRLQEVWSCPVSWPCGIWVTVTRNGVQDGSWPGKVLCAACDSTSASMVWYSARWEPNTLHLQTGGPQEACSQNHYLFLKIHSHLHRQTSINIKSNISEV